MIHYHGTPVSGSETEAGVFLSGRHGLVSFVYPQHLPVVADVCQSFVLDNGAFTTWKRGATADFVGYLNWVRLWHRHPGFDWALIPDVIDGTTSDNDALIRAWPGDVSGVPVWHMHEPVERLTALARQHRVVALGSSGQWPTPGAAGWWGRMHEAMRAVCDRYGRPRCKLHGLRMMDPKIFGELPLSSADSTNASVNAGSISRFGTYPAPGAGSRARTIAERIEKNTSAPVWADPLACI